MGARISSGAGGAALFLIFSPCAGPAHAQEAPVLAYGGQIKPDAKADAAEAAEEARDDILVIGHRQHGAVVTDIPPDVSLNSTAIHALAAADLEEVFADLAPEIGNDADASGVPGKAPIVLVNGQRIAGFSSIKDLPPEAVRRIEIFPAAVALQYGYAADQRVVNVVLRSQYRALTLLGRYTFAPENWRGVYRAKVDLLRIGENSHWNLDLDYRHQDPLSADSTLAGPITAAGGTAVSKHILAAQDDHLTISGAATRALGTMSAELTGSLDLHAVQSRPGLSDQDGDLLAAEGLSDLVNGPLQRVDRTVEAQTNLTLNGRLDSWRWSLIGKLDDSTRETRTGQAVAGGGLDPILLPSPTLLGRRCDTTADAGCVSTETRQASADFYLNGGLFALPAGAVTAALRSGVIVSGIRSASPLVPSADRNRNEGSAQANLDFPITAQDFALGKLSFGVNGELQQLSDFGTLSTFGSTLTWSPARPVNILASFSRTQQAPSLLQLGEATLDTPDLREYDFVTGATTIVQRMSGGNGDLVRQTSRVANVRLQVTPIRATDLTLSAEYTLDRDRNPIASITAATPATMAAFPDMFTRANGYLTAMDVRAVNLARRDRQQVRFGINYSTAFGGTRPATAATASSPAQPPSRNQFQIALYDTWHLQDDVLLRGGQRGLDLLDGDTISDGGGTPTHQIDLQTTVSTEAWSVAISAAWQTPTTTVAGALAQQRLTFSQGVTLDLRLQLNLADQRWLVRWLPWVHGNLSLSADNLLGAHSSVHDANGVVPAAYSDSYLNPTGRTFRITLRKRFR